MGDEEKPFDGDIPTISVRGNSPAEAWEKSILALNQGGIWYARGGEKDKGGMQVDSTMIITIKDPRARHLIHKFPKVPTDSLLEYGYEFLGAKDGLVVNPAYGESLETDTRWPYDYHGRLVAWGKDIGLPPVDQIEEVINRLANHPDKRNGQMITWQPPTDLGSADPACMQRVWCFLVPMPDGSFRLNTNYSFRSRNPMTAAPMNLFGESVLQDYMAEQIGLRMGKVVTAGRLVDMSDSYHISNRDQPLFQDFLRIHREDFAAGKTIEDRSYERGWAFGYMETITEEINAKIAGQIKDRHEERLVRNPDKRGRLEEELGTQMGNLGKIHDWMTKYIAKG